MKIRSESRFMWQFIWGLIKTPVILVLVLMGRRDAKDLAEPFVDFFRFIVEPKFTFFVCVINIVIYYLLAILQYDFSGLMNFPNDIITGRYLTLITAGFLHADPAHLWLNILAIYIFGRIVERRFGVFKTGLIYFIALIMSSAFSSLFHIYIANNNIPGLGASGALMGLVAAAVLMDPFYIVHHLIIPLPVMLLGWLTIYADVQGILQGAKDGIGHIAHLAGFMAIAIALFLFVRGEHRSRLVRGFLINVVSLVIGLGLYFYFF
ncbi:rhomboid family intramembrane serine protease [Candidatus Woesearchaeota archaeon]|nr:rhomboid family intramembrane serine protease [Candidatus Woesearchaeota archaeon]